MSLIFIFLHLNIPDRACEPVVFFTIIIGYVTAIVYILVENRIQEKTRLWNEGLVEIKVKSFNVFISVICKPLMYATVYPFDIRSVLLPGTNMLVFNLV